MQVVVETTRTPFSSAYQMGQTLQLPIAHADGNFFADADVIDRLENNQQVVLRYTQEVNGSVNRIAGICNEKGNVVGMMPHPERNLWPTTQAQGANLNGDGRGVFDSILSLGLSLLKA